MSDIFIKMYDLMDEEYDKHDKDDLALMKFGFKLMKQVFFGEMSIQAREDAWEKRKQERREIHEYRRHAEIAEQQRKQEEARKAALKSGADTEWMRCTI